MKYNRRKWSALAVAVVFSLGTSLAGAAGVSLAKNLRSDGRKAQQACMPLLLEFSALACDYCRLLEREVLNPTLLNRDYDRRVLMRKLLIDSPKSLKDFTGSKITAEQLAARYRVFVTPTLLFVDRQGRELTERMVGVTTLDFYAGYLDIALDASRDALHKRGACDDSDDSDY